METFLAGVMKNGATTPASGELVMLLSQLCTYREAILSMVPNTGFTKNSATKEDIEVYGMLIERFACKYCTSGLKATLPTGGWSPQEANVHDLVLMRIA